MDLKILFIGLMHFFHIFATVVWIGGMTMNAFAIMPSLQETLTPPEIGKVMGAVMQRFKKMVYGSILILFVTGALLTLVDSNYEGTMVIKSVWSVLLVVKHILVLILAVLAYYAFDILAPKVGKLAAGGPSPELDALKKKQMAMAKLGFLLGMSILLCTGLVTAIK